MQSTQKIKMKHNFFSLILISFAQLFFSQERTAKLKTIQVDGFHQLMISPEIRSASKNNGDILRIFDSKKNEIPYVFFQKNNNSKSQKSFEIISKNAITNKLTDVVILNKDAEKLNQIWLKIANTEVAKRFNISGSNDGNEWFGLVDNQFVDELSDPKSTFVVREFTFPFNQYKYLKFTFLDKNSLPVNVMEAFSEAQFQNSISPIVLSDFTQKIIHNKETKETVVTLQFKEPQVVDAFKIEVSNPNFYLRNATISVPKTRNFKKRTETFEDLVSLFQLSSKNNKIQEISSVFSKEFTITIENQDNSPLEIRKINLYQNPVSVLADLKKGENYTMVVNPKLNKPNYDLAASGINFNQNFPEAKLENLDQLSENKTEDEEKNFWQKPLFMWVCIIFAIGIIAFFALGLVKDMNKE